MSQLTVAWAAIYSNPLSSENPLQTELTPSSTYLTPYTPAAGWPVVPNAANTAAYMTVQWQPRRGGTALDYRPADLSVAPGVDDPEPENPTETTPTETTPTNTTPTETTPELTPPTPENPAQTPGQVRPQPAPTVQVVSSIARRTFTAKGLTVRIALPAGARVSAVLVRRDRTTKQGKPVVVVQKLSWTVEQRLAKGRNVLRLKSSAAGNRRLRGRTTPLVATLEVKVAYADHTTRTVRQTVALTPPTLKRK